MLFYIEIFISVSLHIKCYLYKSMVQPIIESASPVWDPPTILYTNKIESIQRSAVRFCFNNYSWTSSVTTMLNKLNLAPLKDRRFHSKSIMMYKILNNLIDILTCYFIPSHHSLRRGYFTQLPARIDSLSSPFPLCNQNLEHFTLFCN